MGLLRVELSCFSFGVQRIYAASARTRVVQNHAAIWSRLCVCVCGTASDGQKALVTTKQT